MKKLCRLAAEAAREIGVLAQTHVTSEDRLLVTENAATNLLSLAAQIALEASNTWFTC